MATVNEAAMVERPLQRFIDRINNANTGNASATTDATNEATDEQKRSTKRSNSGPKSSWAGKKRKPRKRSGKRKSIRSNTESHEDHKVSGLNCRCGAKAVYDGRCEDCYADDSARWSGKDRSAIIHW